MQFAIWCGSLIPNINAANTVSYYVRAGNLKFQSPGRNRAQRFLRRYERTPLTDFISGEILDDTLDERYLQNIARLLVHEKGFSKSEITARQKLEINAGGKCANLWINYIVALNQHPAMLIHYGPGSLVTRHRPALAMSRLAESYQIPRIVVTNGEQADILDGDTGRIIATGLDQIPSKDQLAAVVEKGNRHPIDPRRKEMEARILMAFEIDDRCPCDDNACIIASRQATPSEDLPG